MLYQIELSLREKVAPPPKFLIEGDEASGRGGGIRTRNILDMNQALYLLELRRNCGARGIRTLDLLLARQLLYQLSYGPMKRSLAARHGLQGRRGI